MSFEDEEIVEPEMNDPLRTTSSGWSFEQMVTCEDCLRANPPTRPTCLYCNARLPLTESTAALRKPVLRPLEEWEQGFNVILLEGHTANLTAESLEKIGDLLHLEPKQLMNILEAGEPLPLARAISLDEASLIEKYLLPYQLRVRTIPDEVLAIKSLPANRIRTLEFTDKSIVGWTFGETVELRALWTEVILCVAGRIIVREMQVEERQARGGPEKEILDTREIDTDEAVLDIYSVRNDGGWRLLARSFDFSCLGESKSLLAAENIVTLSELIRKRATEASYDDSYRRVRHALHPVWPLDQHTESRGWHRVRSGGYSTEAVTISTNATQFSCYSRLRYLLELSKRELKNFRF